MFIGNQLPVYYLITVFDLFSIQWKWFSYVIKIIINWHVQSKFDCLLTVSGSIWLVFSLIANGHIDINCYHMSMSKQRAHGIHWTNKKTSKWN